jgi:hypothetical protein
VGASLSIRTTDRKLDRRIPTGLKRLWHERSGFARALPFCVSRIAFASFLLLTSVYCLLVWVPFSYFGFIRYPLMSWIPLFVRLHASIYAGVLIAVGLTQISSLRRRETRTAVSGFLALNCAAVVCLWRNHTLARIEPGLPSYIWSLLSLFPLLWLAALDVREIRSTERGSRKEAGQFITATAAGIIVTLAFGLTSWLRAVHDGNAQGSLLILGLAASFCLHIVLFTAIGLTLDCLAWVSRRTASFSERTNHVLTGLLAWFLIFQFLDKIILPTISFEGLLASIFAAVVAFVLVLFTASLHLGFSKHRPVDMRSKAFTGRMFAFGTAIIFPLAYGIPLVLGRTDWDFVLQRIAVIALWLLAWRLVCGSSVVVYPKVLRIAAMGVAVAALVGYISYARSALYNPYPTARWQSVLDDYSGIDLSFKTAGDIFSRRAESQSFRQFHDLLKRNTNLDRNTAVGPVDTSLVAGLCPTNDVKPNIFVFVIDSLRRDFISPYNSAVDYTPEIGRFAADSVVMDNAFTRYGGTALSEPAIWVGAMQLHKQYIEPFYPMNNLQKLLDIDGYQGYISVDPILSVLLHPSSAITELDKNTKSWSDLDFIPTLKELEAKIDSRTDRTKPIFAYTQPQNVHTLTLERSKIPGGRKAVSIYELRRMDAAFGEFLNFLRQQGLYENSIIILTADHGDCYGEFGRWGHSDFLFPPVIRVPLIFHLPARIQQQVVSSPHEVAFTTDITPSLFYLLGHRPIINNEMFGRPLFTETSEEQKTYSRAQYLIVASYAPVYAILSGNAHSLFIADAVNSKNYYYNLVDDPDGVRSHVTVQAVRENQALIERYIEQIDDFYHWHPGN